MNINHFLPKKLYDVPLGYIDISLLYNWKPENIIRELLLYIFALFYYHDSCTELLLERYKEYKYNRLLYEKKIKYFTEKYANPIICKIHNRNHDWNFDYAENDV